MKQLTVLYDPACGLCVRCRQWLSDQPKIVDMRFIPQGSRRQEKLYPTLKLKTDAAGQAEELIAIDDLGRVYRDDKAWIACFFALRRYRSLSMKLAGPGMAGLARRAYHLVARNRHALSHLLGLGDEQQVIDTLRQEPDAPGCHDALCALKHARKQRKAICDGPSDV